MSNGRFCILLTQCVGKKKEKTLLKKVTSKVDVLPGTLLFIVDVIKNSTTSQSNFVLETLDPDNIEITTDSSSFKEVSEDRYNLLITIPTCGERLTVFQNKEWLQEGLELGVNDYVEVYVKDLAKDVLGIIRYKGPVSGLNGIHFGVELVDHPGKGISDGIFRKKRYFSCNEDSAVFVGLHRIRKCKRQVHGHRKRQIDGAAQNYQSDILRKANGLSRGSRVVWMADHGPESGEVKWIGVLPDCPSSDDITVGVEFDNPVGTGTGKYKDQRLFSAKQNHASLVPILGLMKEEEFYNVHPRESGNDDAYLSDELCVTAEAFNAGKTQEEVIEEQHRMLEIAKKRASRPPVELPNQNQASKLSGDLANQNRPPMASGDVTNQKRVANTPDYGYSEKDLAKKQDFTVIETKADVFIPRPDINSEGTSAINPLYEYSRSADDYLKEGLGAEALVSHGSHSNPSKKQNIPEPDPDLEIGSLVEVMSTQPLYGYIKWIGHLPDQKEPRKLIAGLEMEEEISAGTDGTFGQLRFFHCPPRKGLFVPLYRCRKDKRFQDERNRRSISSDTNFGSTETPDLPGTVSPPDSLQDIKSICGKGRGIQGHHNSCYMDATLLAMFYFTPVFDSILHREKNVQDIPEYTEVQQVLKEGIVNPLRRHHYVRADKVMKLRKLLDKVGKIPGMMSEEKDPEEFLNLLLNEITRAEPFLHISSADNQDTQHTYFYQLIMEKDEQLILPTTQQLFELSFLQMGIKLKEIPSCLIIQMPRFGKDYKMYRRILPSLELDITDVLENAPRECIICGDLAAFECKECYQVHGAGLYTIAFCEGCKTTSHQHKQRVSHRPKPISVPQGFKQDHARRKASGKAVTIPREKMELFAVVCIQTSHYVSFVKCGKGRAAKWIFFDSMADRMGEQSGYNIPEIKDCSEIPTWLSEEYYNDIMKYPEDKTLPEHMRRLICDAYICMYQSPDVMMFK